MHLIRPYIVLAIVFSIFLSGQALLVPFYMMQIYMRVVPSQSFDTLVFLSMIAVFVLVLFSAFEFLRRYVMTRAAIRLEAHLAGRVLLNAVRDETSQIGQDVSLMRDIAVVRTGLSSPSFLALFDIPFIPLFIALLFYLHPLLGAVTLVGALILIAVATLNQVVTSKALKRHGEAANRSNLDVYGQLSNAELIRAHGMYRETLGLWGKNSADSLTTYLESADRAGVFDALSKGVRLLIQIGLLGFGGYLVIQSHMSVGIIFAASIVGSRALAPIEQAIGGWKLISQGRSAYRRVRDRLDGADLTINRTELPPPTGQIGVEKLVYAMPGGDPILKGFSFSIPAGETVAVIGPNGAGKSTMARLLVNAIHPTAGAVRLDGNDLRNWDPISLGQHIGYMPQSIDFIQGTVAQNIARFQPGAEAAEDAVAAAQLVGAHQTISSFPAGYDTVLGPGKYAPSTGQSQLIGLARAFYRMPKFIVLDEPNSNLDHSGDEALVRTIMEAQKRAITLIIITQRPNILQIAGRVLILKEGRVENYGLRDEILPHLMKPVSQIQSMEAAAR